MQAAVRAELERQQARIARHMLFGSNRLVVDLPFGQQVVYEVPRWREQPLKRARLTVIRIHHLLNLLRRAHQSPPPPGAYAPGRKRRRIQVTPVAEEMGLRPGERGH